MIFLSLCWILHRRDAGPCQHAATPAPARGADGRCVMSQFLPVVVLAALAIVFGALSLGASRLLAPRRPSDAKEAPYECGIVPSREPPERFPVGFYIVAMLFIMFDIEIIFLYPYAVSRSALGAYGFWSIVVFSVIFFLSFVYVVARGGLDWGPLQRSRVDEASPTAMVSPERTTRTTIRRVGTRRPAGEERRRGKPRSRGISSRRHPRRRARRAVAQRHHRQAREADQLGAGAQLVAGQLRAGVLCDRDDGHRRRALRHLPLRHGGVPGIAATGRHHDRGRAGEPEDGAGAAPGLRPDDGAQVGHLDGCVRVEWRDVQQLRDRAGRRPDRSGRRLRAGLPAHARDAAARDRDAARIDRERRALAPPRARRGTRVPTSTSTRSRRPVGRSRSCSGDT